MYVLRDIFAQAQCNVRFVKTRSVIFKILFPSGRNKKIGGVFIGIAINYPYRRNDEKVKSRVFRQTETRNGKKKKKKQKGKKEKPER